MLPKPEDVYWDAAKAKDVLDTVASKLGAGEWSFAVPNQALKVVKDQLAANEWCLCEEVQCGRTTHLRVRPERQLDRDLQRLLDDMGAAARPVKNEAN